MIRSLAPLVVVVLLFGTGSLRRVEAQAADGSSVAPVPSRSLVLGVTGLG